MLTIIFINFVIWHSWISIYLLLNYFLSWTFITCVLFCFLIFFFFYWLPLGIWSFRARDQIRATVATYVTAVAMPDPLTHCTRARNWTCVLMLQRGLQSHCATVETPQQAFNLKPFFLASFTFRGWRCHQPESKDCLHFDPLNKGIHYLSTS